MANIQYQTSSFQAANPWGIQNGPGTISLSLDQLITAAVTVGHPDWTTVTGGNRLTAIAQLFWKASSTLMTLGENTLSNYYAATDRFISLDPSEKRGATYQMGLTLTKAFSDILFNAPWLMHLDVYRHGYGISLGPSSVRPDLFGMDSAGRWIVFECKGLSNPPSPSSQQTAKRQARRVTHVAGTVPAARMSFFAYFEQNSSHSDRVLQVYLEDPEPIELSKATEAIVIQEYYRPLLSLFDDTEPNVRQQYTIQAFPDLDLTVQLDTSLLKMLRRGRYRHIRKWLALLHQSKTGLNEETSLQSMDGFSVKVGPSWKERSVKRGDTDNVNVDE